MIRPRILRAILLAAFLGGGGGAAVLLDQPAAAADEKQSARAQIGQPVKEAEQFLKQKKFKEALEKLQAADAVPDKTPYERYVIEGTRAAVLLNSGNYADATKALEAVLATGILAPQDALQRIQALVQLNYQLKNYAQAVDYANRYYRDGGGDESIRLLQAQAYYLLNDFASAAKTIRVVIDAEEKKGKRPDENFLLMLLNSEYRQKNEPDRIEALEIMVADYPKPEYWSDLLTAIQKKPGFSSRLTLDLDRLMAAVGALKTADDYMHAAQLALLAGLPGDGKSFLDKGFAAGVLGQGAQADREKRLADMASKQAADDLNSLPQISGEADAADIGLTWVKLGDAYASYGQFDKAIAAYQKGLQKGGLQAPNDAKLHLGVAFLLTGQKAKAKAALLAVTGGDGTRDLAQLWLIEGGVE
jgi:tetratricopeptide (TPR) repeat protein